MTEYLGSMFSAQRKLQTMLLGIDPQHMDRADQLRYITTMVTACTDELHEALNETGWKPWTTSDHINTEAFKDELVDGLLFWINLALVAGMTSKDVYNRYHEKRANAERRFNENYDGVSTKCPKCKRAYDNKAVMCYPAMMDAKQVPVRAWCSMEGTPNPHPDLTDQGSVPLTRANGIIVVNQISADKRCPACAQPYEENINGCCPPTEHGFGWCGVRVQSVMLSKVSLGGERIA